MSTHERIKPNGFRKKLSLNRAKDSIHVHESQLRAALKSRSLREEQIEFLCELLSIESDRRRIRLENPDFDDLFMQGKIFC